MWRSAWARIPVLGKILEKQVLFVFVTGKKDPSPKAFGLFYSIFEAGELDKLLIGQNNWRGRTEGWHMVLA